MTLRIALCQINPTVGDLAGNSELIVAAAQQARASGARVAVFPELALTAYSPRDLLDRPHFVGAVEDAVRGLVSRLPPELACIVGAPISRPSATHGGPGRRLVNAALHIEGGKLVETVAKRLLPTYDVFDDDRYFEAGHEPGIVVVEGRKLGVTICEDMWNVDVPEGHALGARRYALDPVREVRALGAELVVNLSGSPFTTAKREGRAAMMASVARTIGVPFVFVNQVGAHDSLVFDGQSAVFDGRGVLVARAKAFEEDLVVVSLEGEPARIEPCPSEEDAVLAALTLGVRDYVRRTGLSRAVLGLSGGIDSALVACIAAQALGPDRVLALAMPSRYSSQHSIDDARTLAEALGIDFDVAPIEPLFAPYHEVLPRVLERFGPPPAGDVTFENVQARLRMTILMAAANRSNAILLNTSNKSEIAVGYSTLYGDSSGGLAVLGDIYKTFVYRLSHRVNQVAGRTLIPESTLTKPPSAELRPNQTDQDSLPPYDVLDAILQALVEGAAGRDALVERGFEPKTVDRVLHLHRISEHKRAQLPPPLIVTSKAFGMGRRMVVARRAGL